MQTDGQPCLWLTVSKWPRHILDKAGFDVVWSAVGVGINCFHDRLSSDHIKLLGILLLTFPPIMIVLGVHCLLGSFLMPDQRERLFVCLFVKQKTSLDSELKLSSTHGCTVWWYAGSWVAAFYTRGSSSPAHQTWSWGWSSPCSALQDALQTSSCSPESSDRGCKKKHANRVHFTFGILSSHLFDFGYVPDESVIIHKVQKLLQLVQVTDVILSNFLEVKQVS